MLLVFCYLLHRPLILPYRVRPQRKYILLGKFTDLVVGKTLGIPVTGTNVVVSKGIPNTDNSERVVSQLLPPSRTEDSLSQRQHLPRCVGADSSDVYIRTKNLNGVSGILSQAAVKNTGVDGEESGAGDELLHEMIDSKHYDKDGNYACEYMRF
jgi:hypothetical protein